MYFLRLMGCLKIVSSRINPLIKEKGTVEIFSCFLTIPVFIFKKLLYHHGVVGLQETLD